MTARSRAQAHTLEGVAAALLVVMSVVLALQMTAVTPLTASTANQHIETQQRAAAHGVLATSADGEIRRAVRYWNSTNASFYGAGTRGYYVGSGPTRLAFLDRLNETFDGSAVAYNVRVVYPQGSGLERSVKPVVYNGAPTENAVTAGRTVTLYDRDRLYRPNGSGGVEPTNRTLADANYFASDASDTAVYSTVRVEVVVWRM